MYPSPRPQLRNSPTSSEPQAPTRLADRLEQALGAEVKLLALTVDERMVILNTLEDPLRALAELRAVLINEYQWRRREGLS